MIEPQCLDHHHFVLKPLPLPGMGQHRGYRGILLKKNKCLKSHAQLVLQRLIHLLQMAVALLADFLLDQGLDPLKVIHIQHAEWQEY